MAATALLLCSGCGGKKDKVEGEVITFSKMGGTYAKAFELEMSTDHKGDIYYTLDGSNPATSSTAIRYESAISISDRKGEANVVSAVSTSLISTNFGKYTKKDGVTCYIESPSDSAVDKCTVVRAAVKDSKGKFSKTSTQTYFIGKETDHIPGIEESCKGSGSKLAVISITMNYDDLFDAEKGIYVKGNIFDNFFKTKVGTPNKFDTENARKYPANYNQRGREWEREAHVEFYEMDASSTELAFSTDCGIRIQGNYSRSDLQKGFRLYARSEYGDTKFNYNVFSNGLEKFDTLTLRAGGNCAFTAKFNDTYWQSLSAELACSTKASRACVVYLNGEYWGLYVLEEDYSQDYFESHYGVKSEDVVVYKGDAETYDCGYKLDEGDLPEGVTDINYYFADLLKFFETHNNLSSQADYNEFCKLVDEQSVMDYFAMESFINNKWDWPGKNWSMWRTMNVIEDNPYADGRFRFCIYDVEFGGVSGEGDAKTNTIKEDNYKPKGLLDRNTNNPAVLCFAYLMTNADFKEAFCSRLMEMSTVTFEKNKATAALDKFEKTYGPLFEQFFARYPGTGTSENALEGGYASAKCIRDFIAKRGNYISKMIDWVKRN